MNKQFVFFTILILSCLGAHRSVASKFDYSNEFYEYLVDLSNDNPDTTLLLINDQLAYLHPDSLSVKGKFLRILGLANLYKVDYAVALDCFIESREIFKMLGLKKQEAMALNNIAVVYSMQGLFGKSLELDQQILRMHIELKDTVSYAGTYNNIAVSYLDLGINHRALENFYKAVVMGKRYFIEEELSMYYYNIGDIHLNANRMDSAFYYFNKSVQNSIKYQDKQLQANAYCCLGKYYIKNEEYRKAIKALTQSLELAKETQIVYEIESATQYLHQAYSAVGEYEQAYGMLLLSKELADSANNMATVQKIIEIEESFKYNKELEIQRILQEKEKIASEMILKNQKLQRNIAYFVVVFIGIVLLLFYRLYRQREKDNKHLIFQNEEIKFQNEEIESQRDKIQELNDNKDKFFGIIAHDLKNPLSGISRLSELLYSELYNLPEDKRELYIKQIADSSNKAYNLLENLLQWAMVQMGRIPVEKEKIDLADLLQDSIDLFKSNTQQKNITIISDVPEKTFAFCDEQMLRTVIRNLIGNAVKFTPDDGQIFLNFIRKDNFCQMSITDTGIGIEPKDIPNLFDAGTSSQSIGNSSEKGNGLGLILCMEFVQQNGGKIWAESEFGKGTTFHFTVPLHID